jgi:hypothetical protein
MKAPSLTPKPGFDWKKLTWGRPVSFVLTPLAIVALDWVAKRLRQY